MAEGNTSERLRARQELRRASRWIVSLFWFVQFVELTAVSFAEGSKVARQSIEPRLLVLVAGVVLTLLLVEVVARLDRRPFRQRLMLTVAWALAFCLVLVTINFGVFFVKFSTERIGFDLTEYIYTAFAWSWFFLSIAGALLALSYHVEVRERDRRLAAMEKIANDAKLAALRYQLNPHFLFNTLNSIASLIDRGDAVVAERMVENLADFLRATLELDPVDDITLAREIELQRLYLAIEEERFPERLRTRFDIPADLADTLVPALITQPIIENAIRHAVARSTAPVTLDISASRQGDVLVLTIDDDAVPLRSAEKGTGVGLANVEARLAGRFGSAQAVKVTRGVPGGFKVELSFPWRARP